MSDKRLTLGEVLALPETDPRRIAIEREPDTFVATMRRAAEKIAQEGT